MKNNFANKLTTFIIFITVSLLMYNKSFAQTPPPKPSVTAVSPDPSNTFCPLPFTFNQISFTIKDCPNSDIEFFGDENLSIQNITYPSNNRIQAEFKFDDQWKQTATIKLRVSSNSSNYWKGEKIAEFVFPKVQSVFQRNIFRIAPNNKIISVPICQSTTNISFTKIQYVRLNGNEAENNDLFGDIDSYQYQLPTGVTPVSGLTPVIGLPNTYSGNNNISVSLSNAFINYTIKVRPTNTNCLQASAGNYNDIILERPQLSVSGISSIRCGETDTKTFTIQNIPASPNCITNYTWQIANKGWKYNGSIPTTNIVTTTPSIQLQSADNNSAPPQSFSVVVTDGAYSVTLNKSINYLAPNISIPIYAGNFGLDCDVTNVNAILTNAPVNSYNLAWSTTSGYTINGSASPQSSGTVTSVSLEKVGTASSDFLTVTLQASCGTINSVGGYSFEGCLPWNDFTVNYMSSIPMKPEPVIAYCSTQDQLPWLVEYEWYWFNGSDFTFAGNTPGLSFWSDTWPCGVRSLYVRAKGYNGTSALKYVGEYDGYCPGYRTTALVEPDFNVYPNPTNDFVIVKYFSLNTAYNIKVTDILGNLKMQFTVKNNPKLDKGLTKIDLSKLKKGKYIIAIQDGKKVKTRIVEKF